MPRGHHPVPVPVSAGFDSRRVSHRLYVHKDVSAQEARGDAHVQSGLGDLTARRKTLLNVPRGKSEEQPYGVRANQV